MVLNRYCARTVIQQCLRCEAKLYRTDALTLYLFTLEANDMDNMANDERDTTIDRSQQLQDASDIKKSKQKSFLHMSVFFILS